MKKIILAAILVVSLAATSFAAPLSFKLNSVFKKAYPAAVNVSWKTNESFTTISFTVNKQHMQAFYNNDGQLLATSRPVELSNLPMAAIQRIHERYNGYTATEAIEFNHAEEGASYYISLQKEGKKVVLNVSSQGDLSVFKKEAI